MAIFEFNLRRIIVRNSILLRSRQVTDFDPDFDLTADERIWMMQGWNNTQQKMKLHQKRLTYSEQMLPSLFQWFTCLLILSTRNANFYILNSPTACRADLINLLAEALQGARRGLPSPMEDTEVVEIFTPFSSIFHLRSLIRQYSGCVPNFQTWGDLSKPRTCGIWVWAWSWTMITFQPGDLSCQKCFLYTHMAISSKENDSKSEDFTCRVIICNYTVYIYIYPILPYPRKTC